MRRRFKLFVNKWTAKFNAAIDALRLHFEQRTCPHSFRPARVNSQCGKVCRMCDLPVELTREEFFAEFGERYQGMIGS